MRRQSVLLAIILLGLGTAPPGAAQITGAFQAPGGESDSRPAAARLGPTLSGTALARLMPDPVMAPTRRLGDAQQAADSLRPNITNITVAAILGSAVGLFAGVLLGSTVAGEDNHVASLFAGAAGSVAGASVAASVAGGRPGRAFVGALGGGLLGLFVGAKGAEVGGGFGALVGFFLTQGIVTGLLARP